MRIRLREGSLPRVEEWARTLMARREEVMETLRREGVTVESAFLERAGDGDFLVYYMRARSLEAAHAAARGMDLPIQAYHDAFKRDAWVERTPLRCLVDFAREDAPAHPEQKTPGS